MTPVPTRDGSIGDDNSVESPIDAVSGYTLSAVSICMFDMNSHGEVHGRNIGLQATMASSAQAMMTIAGPRKEWAVIGALAEVIYHVKP